MNELQTLQSLGLVLPSPAYVFGIIFFSFVGLAAYRYGKKARHKKIKWTGIAIMLYPYFVYGAWPLYAVGFGLCALLFVYRRK